MDINIITLILGTIIIIPIIEGIILGYSKNRAWDNIKWFLKIIAGGSALIITFYKIDGLILELGRSIALNMWGRTIEQGVKLFVVIGVIYVVIYLILKGIGLLIIQPILTNIKESNRTQGKVYSGVFAMFKSVSWFIIAVLFINLLSSITGDINLIETANESNLYRIVDNKLVEPTKDLLYDKYTGNASVVIQYEEDDTAEVVDAFSNKATNVITYYNGVTIGEGMQDNEGIKELTYELTSIHDSDVEKAKAIYDWIVDNIEYDYDKVELLEQSSYRVNSGAIAAYEERKGVCFDYACLYAAMCRNADIPVRIIAGEAFDGENWANHAWNEIYIEDRWIKIDTTFGVNGRNYFDNNDAFENHKPDEIIGEWR